MKPHLVTMVLIATLLIACPLTHAEPPAVPERGEGSADVSTLAIIGDLLIIRPLGLVATGLGCVAFAVALPFSAAAGNTEEMAQKLVFEPANFSFRRPLGHNPLGTHLASPNRPSDPENED
jgi:hypothetical protein